MITTLRLLGLNLIGIHLDMKDRGLVWKFTLSLPSFHFPAGATRTIRTFFLVPVSRATRRIYIVVKFNELHKKNSVMLIRRHVTKENLFLSLPLTPYSSFLNCWFNSQTRVNGGTNNNAIDIERRMGGKYEKFGEFFFCV